MAGKRDEPGGFFAYLRRERAEFFSVLGLWCVLLVWLLLFPENVAESRAHGLPLLLLVAWPAWLLLSFVRYRIAVRRSTKVGGE